MCLFTLGWVPLTGFSCDEDYSDRPGERVAVPADKKRGGKPGVKKRIKDLSCTGFDPRGSQPKPKRGDKQQGKQGKGGAHKRDGDAADH
ncbi:MAG: hypothetical protein CM15mP39_07170 [Synechococcus sp.]|nr:MAG: hypothetical protein CM15mP39_07170 [Synechococcus sp.]